VAPLSVDEVTPDGLGRGLELELELELELVELEPFEPFVFDSSESELSESELESPSGRLSSLESSLLSPSSPSGVLVGSGLVEVELGLRIVEVEVIV
jgi:hypothetical protein